MFIFFFQFGDTSTTKHRPLPEIDAFATKTIEATVPKKGTQDIEYDTVEMNSNRDNNQRGIEGFEEPSMKSSNVVFLKSLLSCTLCYAPRREPAP